MRRAGGLAQSGLLQGWARLRRAEGSEWSLSTLVPVSWAFQPPGHALAPAGRAHSSAAGAAAAAAVAAPAPGRDGPPPGRKWDDGDHNGSSTPTSNAAERLPPRRAGSSRAAALARPPRGAAAAPAATPAAWGAPALGGGPQISERDLMDLIKGARRLTDMERALLDYGPHFR